MSLGIKAHVVGLEQDINRIVRKVNTKGIVLKVNANDFTQPLGRMSAKANEFTKSLEASNARVIAFGASAAIIGGVTTAFSQLVIQAAKVEKILTDINVVLNTSAANLDKFGKGLFQVARNTSQALEVAAEAALEFSRQGLTMEETLKRTNDALVLTRLTGMKAADAVKGLTAAVNGFADAGLNTTQIINKLAAVDVKFAVSADDLINALSRAGAVAQDAGVNFDQLVGAVTAAQQITARGGAVIGNSFKTIFTRIQRSSTIQRLQELGVVVRDLRGQTLPALTVLQNLASSYDNLQSATKAAVAEQVGGVFQINILKAALKDLNKETSLYADATNIASRATNEAEIKNAQLQKTLNSIANQTLTSVRELTASIGELTIAPALKDFLELANSALDGLNKIFGDKEGENLGHQFAKSFVGAIGSVITGPGMMITILVFAKLFGQAFKFAKNSIKDLLEIKSIKEQERIIQEGIVDAMMRNVDLSKELIKADGDQVKQEGIILNLLKEQTAYLEKQRSIARNLAPGLLKSGVNPNLTVGSPKGNGRSQNQAQGFIPNFASKNWQASTSGAVTPVERLKEQAGASKGGYVAGQVASMMMPDVGRVVYNKNETVKRFSGMSQPAIMPPEDSRAGERYKMDFAGKHGFDPYTGGSKNNATYNSGFIPNFAAKDNPKSVAAAILMTLRKRGVKVRPNDPKLNFAAQRYMSATENSDYPGGSVTVGNQRISMNEITLALKKHGDYMPSEIDGPVIESSRGELSKSSSRPMSDTMAWLTGSKNNATYNQGFTPNFAKKSTIPFVLKNGESVQVKSTQMQRLRMGNHIKVLNDKGNQVSVTLDDFSDPSAIQNWKSTSSREAQARDARRQLKKTSGKVSEMPDIARRKRQAKLIDTYQKDLKKLRGNIGNVKLLPNGRLYMGKSKMHFQMGKDFNEKVLRGRYKLNSYNLLSAHINDVLGKGSGINHLKEVFQWLKRPKDKGGLGVQSIARHIFFGGQKLKRSAQLDLDEAKREVPGQSKDDNFKRSKLFGAKFETRGISNLNKNLGKNKYRNTQVKGKDTKNNFPVDAFGLGLAPTEFKGGAWKSENIISKSLQLFSDPALVSLKNLLNNPEFKHLVNSGALSNLKSSGNLLSSHGLLSKNASMQETSSAVRGYNLHDGFIPNFSAAKAIQGFNARKFKPEEFNLASGALSKFNAGNSMFARTALSGSKGLKLTQRNYEKFRQFINSKEFRNLDPFVQNKVLATLKYQSKKLDLPDVTRGYTQHSNPLFQGRIAASLGFVPNFADPLEDAISREKAAKRGGRIYVDQDNRLKNRKNPMGLLVANTRDEPLDGSQGVNRSLAMGIDPRTHGSQNNATYNSGFIPSFAETNIPITNTGLQQFVKSNQKASKSIDALSGNMFMLTTVAYGLEGALQGFAGETESTGMKVAKLGTSIAQGVGQAGLITPMFLQLGDNLKSSGKELGGWKGKAKVGFGSVIKGLGLVGGIAAAIVPIMGALKENFDYFKSGLEIAARDFRKAAEGLSNLENVSEGLAKQQENNVKILELETVGKGRSYEQEKQLLQLKFEEKKNQIQLKNELNKLASSVGLTNSQSEKLNGSYAEQVQVLQELKLAQLRMIDIIQGRRNFLENVDQAGGTSAFAMSSDGALIERAAKLRGRQFASSATSDVDFSNVDVRGVISSLQSMQTKIGQRTPGSDAYSATSISQRFNLVDDSDFERLGKSLGFEGQRLEQFIVDGASEMKAAFKSVNRGMADLNFEDEAQVVQFLFGRFRQSLIDMVNGASGNADAQKENDKLAKLQAATLAEGLKYLRDQNAAYELKHSKIMQQIQLDSKVSDFMQKRASIEQSILDSMGLMTDQAKIRFDNEQKQASFEARASEEKRRLIAEASKAQRDNLAKTLRPDRISASEELFDETSGLKNDNAISQMANRKQDLRGAMQKSNLDIKDTDLVDSIQEGYRNILKGIDKRRSEGDKIVTREELNAEILNELGRSTSIRVKQSLLKTLQSEKIIALQGDEADKLQEMLKNSDAKLKNDISFIDKKAKLDISTLSEQEKEANIRARTAIGLEIVSKNLKSKQQIDLAVSNNLREQLKTSEGFARIDQLSLDSRIKYFESLEGSRQLIYEQLEVQKLAVGKERESLILQIASIKARNQILESTDTGVSLASDMLDVEYQKLNSEKINLQNKLAIEDLEQRLFATATLQHSVKMGQLDFDGKTLDAKIRLYESTDALEKEVSAELENARKNRKIDRSQKREKFKQQLSGGDFQVEGMDQIEDAQQTLVRNREQLAAKLNFYQNVQNNQLRAAEVAIEYAENQKNLNIELNKGSLFADSLKVKIAEADARAQRFAETLANTSFDAVRDGFVNMFNDLADGSKRTSTVMLEFAAGIAKKIRDKIFENAADRLSSGLFKAFGMDKYHTGGYVAKYNSGGGASGDIPAMLTNGEYVVRKKVVDRIGVNTMDKLNETGSLDELYNKPNEDNFELEPQLGFAAPQGFKDGGEVKSMLSKIVGFKDGGKADYGMYRDIGYGVGAMGGATLAGWMNRDKRDETKPPEAPNTSSLNTRSNLNLDFSDARMSPMFRAQDRASQDYGGYLLDKYQYDVDRRNQKQEEKMALKKDLFTSLAVIGGTAIGNALGYKIKDGITSARLKGSGISGPNGSKIFYDSKSKSFSGVDKDGKTLDLASTNRRLQSWGGDGGYNLNKGSHAAKFLRTEGMHMQDRKSIFNPSSVVSAPSETFSKKVQQAQGEMSQAYNTSLQADMNRLQKRFESIQTQMQGLGTTRPKRFNTGGMVSGPTGIDKVGPVMLNDGEYVLKASSVKSIEQSYPGMLDRLNGAVGYKDGGYVGKAPSTSDQTTSNTTNNETSNTSSSNVTVNINVGANGSSETSVSGSGSQESAAQLGSKIKEAVLSVMSQEMRVGGMLR